MRTPVDRAILVGTPGDTERAEDAREHLAELGRLTDTAGGVIVGRLVQRRRSPGPRYYLGRGKAAELSELVREHDANLIIFDDELTPAQGKNLEELCGVRVMDRAELILDIFATRARTREARMQVELAQLQYLLPRLRRMWIHLSRIRGGIGLRGPGETQLETDRRLIGTRIAELRRKLRGVARAEAVRRKRREGSFRAALVGYTNAGKSSLLQALSGAKQRVEDRLFATLDASTRIVDVGDGHEVLVTDTVGFIRKLPHHLIASFRSTLEEAAEADVLLHVIDASHPHMDGQRRVVRDVLEELDLRRRPRIVVFNKIDLLGSDDLLALRKRFNGPDSRCALFASAVTPATLEPLRGELRARIRARMQTVDVEMPAAEGKTLAALYHEGEVLSRSQDGCMVRVVANAPPALIGRLRSTHGVRVKAHQSHGGFPQ
ncbi:MAG: GTPase HflX [Gemmatimonadetes bacterium]|nr:GTPase HflX [Gemmatimonadota bacterium]MCY3677673.1 GTPase HflX [Gemmatimonadota bacterium]MYA42306.1 GTPase HflX [Gemmatimonadota bacterium]MYE92250.1 GTPase HflX [Gemmatimonadota bacterium]MYJ11647.1 GTPase HflX [Gemmatimonadota bacterium]